MPWLGASGVALLAVLLVGCARDAVPTDSEAATQAWAAARGWSLEALPAADFRLLALLRQRASSAYLTVYIEGDGAAWATPRHPPQNPTPRRSLVLALAERDQAMAVAYLGRPCQYLSAAALAACSRLYWTQRRFAPEVVVAMDQALSQLKQRVGARHLRLVGYSGGGVLATLLAQRRTDVAQLVTLAAPLALREWERLLQLSPLQGSLDPLDGPTPQAPALHLSGEEDAVVPTAVTAHFVARHGGRLQRLPGFDHQCCWVQHWPALLRQPVD